MIPSILVSVFPRSHQYFGTKQVVLSILFHLEERDRVTSKEKTEMSSRRNKLSSTDEDIVPNNGWGVTNLIRTIAGLVSAAMLGSYMITNGCGNAGDSGGFPSLLPDPSVYGFDDRFRKQMFASSESSSATNSNSGTDTKKYPTKNEQDVENSCAGQESFTMVDLDRMRRGYEKQMMEACQTKDFHRIRWITSILEVVHEIEVLSKKMKQNLDSGRHKHNQSLSAYLNDAHKKLRQALEEEEADQQSEHCTNDQSDTKTVDMSNENPRTRNGDRMGGPRTRYGGRIGHSLLSRRKSGKSLNRQAMSPTSSNEERKAGSASGKRRTRDADASSSTQDGDKLQKTRKLSSPHSPRAVLSSKETVSRVSVDTDSQDDDDSQTKANDCNKIGDKMQAKSASANISSAVSQSLKRLSGKTQEETSGDDYSSTDAEFSDDESGNEGSDLEDAEEDKDDTDMGFPPYDLKPGSVSKDHWYYSTLLNETVYTISKKLGCQAADILNLRYNVKNAPDFDQVTRNPRNSRFKSKTILQIPKSKCWGMTLEELEERSVDGDGCQDEGDRLGPDFLRGWTTESRPRPGSSHVDHYYFSPICNFKLRSLAEVRRFQSALVDCDGDETQAICKAGLKKASRPQREEASSSDMHATV